MFVLPDIMVSFKTSTKTVKQAATGEYLLGVCAVATTHTNTEVLIFAI